MPSVNDNEFYWNQLAPGDYVELTSKRKQVHRCRFCQRIVNHRPDCPSVVLMPFGKHKGKPVHDVPKSYLAWCLESGIGSDSFRKLASDLTGLPYFESPQHQISTDSQ